MKKMTMFLVVFVLSCIAYGQSITNYTFSATGGTYSPITGGSSVLKTGSAANFLGDDVYSDAIPIGFTFYYMGTPYTNVYASTNGFVSFNTTIADAGSYNNLTSSAASTRPLLAPLWDDLKGVSASGSTASYITEGTIGSRIFTVEWNKWLWNYSATGATISFQVKLYEANGKVEFIYQPESGNVTSPTASIGITATATSSGKFLSLDGTGSSPTVSSTTETTSISSKPASGQIYAFTPPAGAPAAATWNSPTSVTGTGMVLNWTDNADNESAYVISRSIDGINYTVLTSLAANVQTYTATGLNFGTTYYWKISAVNEGAASEIIGIQATSAGLLSGDKAIPGDYATLTAAFADITANGLNGNVNLILQSDYTGAGETYPILGSASSPMGTFTATVYPAVSGLSITSANTTGTINLNGSRNIIFDGRVGATGLTKDLVIENTTANGYAMQFVNDANSNTVKYCTIKGVNTSNSSGVVVFSITSGTIGNDNNTIDNCDLRDGATKPKYLIYSSGTATTSAQQNSGNTISNCNLYNYNASTSTAGIYINANTTGWNINGNSFYQSSAYAGNNSTTAYGIYIYSGCGYTITGNYFGGSAANCGSTPWTINGTVTGFKFVGIYLTANSTPANSVQNNTIKNFDWLSSTTDTSLPGVWCGIYAASGDANIGNLNGNTIGDASSNSSIKITTTGNGGMSCGIGSASTGTVTVNNNTIASIDVLGSAVTISHSINGLLTTNGIVTINNNTIGSTTQSNSINALTAANSSTAQYVIGIKNSSTSVVSITNNTVANLNNAYTGSSTTGQIIGISSINGTNTINGNNIRNLSNSAACGTYNNASVIGIHYYNGYGVTLNKNTINALSNSNASAQVTLTGLYCAPSTGVATVVGNKIFGISLASTNATSIVNGLQLYGTTSGLTAQNNMIEVGNSISQNCVVNGIHDYNGVNNYYFNSVYVGGTVSDASTTNTFAFNNTATNTRSYKNNIFVNARTNTSGTAKHYSATYATAGTITADNNVFYAPNTGGILGLYNSADKADLASWRSATGKDYASMLTNPQFNDPTNAIPDLHINTATPTAIESNGTDVSTITDDFDGQVRANFTQVDIGADAGNFIGLDINAPVISCTNLTSTYSLANPVLSNVVITDASGVSFNSGSAPRLYYKKSTEANTFSLANDATANGWKWVECTTTSPCSFTIDYSKLNSPITAGNTIQYFVVAQDITGANNTGASPITGFEGTSVSAITIAPTTPNSYTVLKVLSGDFTVGGSSSPNYATLTAAFADITANKLSGNVNLILQSGYVSTGETFPLATPISANLNNFSVKVYPAVSGLKISASNSTGILNINGSKNITFDGRVGATGTAKDLIIENLGTSGYTVQMINDASYNTLKYCDLTGANTSSYGVVQILSTTGSTGNDYNTIDNCSIHDNGSELRYPFYMNGTSGKVNDHNTISNCNIYNFRRYGVYGISYETDLTLTNNSFYQATEIAGVGSTIYGINSSSTCTNWIIDGNSIGGKQPLCGGTAWTYTTGVTNALFRGISVAANAIIQNNTITNFAWWTTSSPVLAWTGIEVTGCIDSVLVKNNVVGSKTETSKVLVKSGSGTADNLYAFSASGGNLIRFVDNTASGLTCSQPSGSGVGNVRGFFLSGTTTNLIVKNNTIGSLTLPNSIQAGVTSSTTAGSFIGIENTNSGTVTISGNTIANANLVGDNTNSVCTGIKDANGATVEKNKILKLNAYYSTGAAKIYGIHISGGTSKTISNNMISLGADVANNFEVSGVNVTGGTPNIYFNSVLVNGTITTGTNNSHAIYEGQSSAHSVKNNIFINQRSGGTGKHYALKTGTATITNMDYNNNLYSVGSGSFFNGIYVNSSTTSEHTNLDAWKTAFNHDANSQSSAIKFIAADSTNGELKYKRDATNAAVFDKGTPITGITTDFYGTTRAQYAQVDIGAYELVQSSGLAESAIPVATSLSQNYPNPFNPETTINFALAKDAQVNLTIFNAKGEVVKTLVNSSIQAGYHSVNFNAVGLNSGVYFYKLTTPESSFMKKMLMVK